MATSRSPAAIPCYLCFLFIVITVGTVNKPALVEAKTPPSTLVLYVHQNLNPPNETALVVVSPSAAKGGSPEGFGSIAVLNNVLRDGVAPDSSVVGRNFGEVAFAIDLSIFIVSTFVVDTPWFSGSISYQGVTNASGFGEVGITTGTGDFRFARGYAELSSVFAEPVAGVGTGVDVFKNVFYIEYGCQ